MSNKNIYNGKDSMDITELASLNDDISPELIDQLQEQLMQNAQDLAKETSSSKISSNFDANDDTTLFEETTSDEVKAESAQNTEAKKTTVNNNFDDNFIKKYKAKLNKQKDLESKDAKKSEAEKTISNAAFTEEIPEAPKQEENIEQVSNGKISEKKMTEAQKNYNDSLDFLDGNVKYSKYVIYIDPQNVDFIDGLTVKERKNLINKILREQDDIAITKKRFRIINTVIKHAVIAILTVTISIPIIYWTINASLEATINNYRHSQSVFQTLYKENGKISSKHLK